MTALHIVLGSDAVVGHSFLLQGIHRICLLQERIADVLLIGKNLFDVALVPLFMAGSV